MGTGTLTPMIIAQGFPIPTKPTVTTTVLATPAKGRKIPMGGLEATVGTGAMAVMEAGEVAARPQASPGGLVVEALAVP